MKQINKFGTKLMQRIGTVYTSMYVPYLTLPTAFNRLYVCMYVRVHYNIRQYLITPGDVFLLVPSIFNGQYRYRTGIYSLLQYQGRFFFNASSKG